MQAFVIEQFGSISVFQTKNISLPIVLPGHVLIRVEATSVNPLDCKIRNGSVPSLSPDFPAVLHGDVAGVVEQVGEGVTKFKAGDEVYGCAGGIKGYGGALADFMLADARLLAKKPSTLSFAEAAALPLVAITAWEALIDRAGISVGRTVLIHGGAGGVGHIAIQLAKWKGAKVYATVSSRRKLEIVEQLGAKGINYRDSNVTSYVDRCTSSKGFDYVFDTVGGDVLNQSFQAAAVRGCVISTSTMQSYDLTPVLFKGLTLHAVLMLAPMLYGFGAERHGEILSEVAKLVDAGLVKPVIDPERFSFAQIASAHQHWESGESVGKIVISR